MTRWGFYENWARDPALGRAYAIPAGRVFDHAVGVVSGPVPAGLRVPPMWDGGADEAVMPYVLEAGQAKPAGLRARDTLPVPAQSWVAAYRPQSIARGAKQPRLRALIAVIDSGLPFLNHAFDDARGRTRIAHLWLQSGRGRRRAAVPFGREITGRHITRARRSMHDEPAIYRALGGVDATLPELGGALLRSASHGAHVMGIAAGNASCFGTQMPDDIGIIGVQLPDTASWDMTGYGKESHLLWALHYVFARAQDIARRQGGGPLPLVINCSYGWPAGRTDGADDLAQACASLLARRKTQAPTEMVIPTGNHFGAGLQLRFEATDQSPDLAWVWRVSPDDLTASYQEIWFPQDTSDGAWDLHITAPDGTDLGAISLTRDPAHIGHDPGRSHDLIWRGARVGQAWAERHQGRRWRIIVALIPTRPTAGQARFAPAGRWGLCLRACAGGLVPGQVIDAIIQRDDDPVRLGRGGRQSVLEPVDGARDRAIAPRLYPDHLGAFGRFGAFNVLATMGGCFAVGGLLGAQRPAPYSSAPAVTHAGQADQVPVIVSATSDRSALRPGVTSLGVLSGTRAQMRGSSVAAPAVARAMVVNLAAGRAPLDGFDPAPDVPALDQLNPLARMLHPYRVGGAVAPRIPPRVEVPRNLSGPVVA